MIFRKLEIINSSCDTDCKLMKYWKKNNEYFETIDTCNLLFFKCVLKNFLAVLFEVCLRKITIRYVGKITN